MEEKSEVEGRLSASDRKGTLGLASEGLEGHSVWLKLVGDL